MELYDLSKAITALSKGEVIVYPTDTLYGLGADIFNNSAVKKVFEIKNRNFKNPLSVAVSDFSEIEKIAYVDENIKNLVDCFLPGKLTFVLKKKKIVPDLITGGFDKVAVRIPDNDIALNLLFQFGPLTATSANIHGKETPDNIKEINFQLKDNVSVYLDYGKLKNKPSTIVDFTLDKPKVLREGAISKNEIMDLIIDG